MNSNILKAIMNLIENPVTELKETYKNKNRANNVGDALEEYVKDLFAGTINSLENERLEKINEVFSYLGNTNNPPDAMLRNGDAIEVKKIESNNDPALPLNSSYPKHKLYSSSQMITATCRGSENWIEKDIIYCVGTVNSEKLKNICFVYGIDYCANDSVYSQIKTKIKDGVESIDNVEFASTKELGKVNRIDPLGITYLRVRGMWGIENPWKVFNYVYTKNNQNKFNFMAIINKEKYNSFSEVDRLKIDNLTTTIEKFELKEIRIKNPNNPANLIDAYLLTYYEGAINECN